MLAFLLQFDVPLAIACLLVLLLGALMGTLAGVLRGVFNVPSFVATLGLWSALRGMGLFMTNALPVPINENEVLDWLGGQFLGVPVSALIMMVLFALFVSLAAKPPSGARFLLLAVMPLQRSCAVLTFVGYAFLFLPFRDY